MAPPTDTTITTRFLIISDTHNFEFNDETTSHFPLHRPLPHADVLLHCGDLTHCGGASSYKKALKMLGAFDAELKLVIAGNHDLELDKEYWMSHLDEGDNAQDHARAVHIMTGPLAAETGVTYLTEGTYNFCLSNGARFSLYASPYSPAFCDWAFEYARIEDRYDGTCEGFGGIKNITSSFIPNGVDIVMTHGPPLGIFDKCLSPWSDVGCLHLHRAIRRARPRMHCFGHIHEGNGMKVVDWDCKEVHKRNAMAESEEDRKNTYPDPVKYSGIAGRHTLMVNAAIMNLGNVPTNAPWLVDLDLPIEESTERSS